MRDPADRLAEAHRRAKQPKGDMAPSGTVDYQALWGTQPAQREADKAPGWASDMRLVAADTTDDLIQEMYPGARPYNGRAGGEFEEDTDG